MTLIAAFWCQGNQAVLCADSQESWGPYKTSVTKLAPQTLARGKYQLAYAGSGLGDFVDALGEKLEQAFDRAAASDWLSLQEQIQNVLAKFYTSSVIKSYPLEDPSDPNNYVSGVICIRVVPLAKVFLFKFSKTVVLPVKDFVLRGLEAPIYSRIVKNLYPAPLLPLHAQLVGLRVLSEAALTSTMVDSPFTTVFGMTHGMFSHDLNTDLYLLALAKVQRAMDAMLITCVDIHAVTNADTQANLKGFARTIVEFRREHKKALGKHYDLKPAKPTKLTVSLRQD